MPIAWVHLQLKQITQVKAVNGELSVVVCEAYSKGDLFHPSFSMEGPHYITLPACVDFLLHRSKQKFVFVENGGFFEPTPI